MTMESDVLIPIPGKPLMVWKLMVCIDINSYRYSLFGTESDSNPTMQVQTDQPTNELMMSVSVAHQLLQTSLWAYPFRSHPKIFAELSIELIENR